MNRVLKRIAETTAVRSGAAKLMRATHRGHALVLAYHNIVPHGEQIVGDRSLHLEQAAFARQLDALAETHEVLPLAELIERPSQPRARPGVVITFDDAYAGALSAGLDELGRRGFPSTIFVAPGLLGETTWWDLIADQKTGVVPDDLRHRALWQERGIAANVLAASPRSVARVPQPPRIATVDELSAASQRPGVSFGSHTWSHPNLAALEPHNLDEELVRPLEWLRARFANVVPAIAYPYGLYSPEVVRRATSARYRAAFRVDGGWTIPSQQDRTFGWPRYNVPAGLSHEGFLLRTAGL